MFRRQKKRMCLVHVNGIAIVSKQYDCRNLDSVWDELLSDYRKGLETNKKEASGCQWVPVATVQGFSFGLISTNMLKEAKTKPEEAAWEEHLMADPDDVTEEAHLSAQASLRDDWRGGLIRIRSPTRDISNRGTCNINLVSSLSPARNFYSKGISSISTNVPKMHQKLLSRKAACNIHGQDSSYFLGCQEYEKNPYDPITNPNGIIQMGLAENQLSLDLVETWLENHPEAAGFKRDGVSILRELALFQDYHGLPAFKSELAKYMERVRGNKVTFQPNKLVLTAGATSANETLMFCLAEPGEAFLLPTPYYPGFDRDLKWRTGAEIVPIHCSISNKFQITKAALEAAYQQARKQRLRVKGVLITNPSNPLGTTMTRHELNTLLDFVLAKDIHLISDEIYSGTNFDTPGPSSQPVKAILDQMGTPVIVFRSQV
ncbi:hypothetical protein Cni_G11790 [Canna indica]|uniref:1-aminocyclopropane-1-carboxylate synthase n=1 Tax=Canna indica TaxID=4628 RepID=A0AAQ3K703_9LILI|nr:hypothetical protein Cni_G11790 [Canna indica]